MRRAAAATLLALAGGLIWAVWLTPRHDPGATPADIALSAPETPVRHLAVLGTSLSLGPWPETLRAALSACQGHDVRLTRVAEPGATSLDGLSRLSRITEAAPDLVLIEFAINDADLTDGLARDDAANNLATMLDVLALETPDARVMLMTMSPAHGLRGLKRPFLARYYDDVRRLAATHGTGLADLYPRWLAREDWRDALPDGLHPTQAAAEALIPPALLPLLTGDTCPR